MARGEACAVQAPRNPMQAKFFLGGGVPRSPKPNSGISRTKRKAKCVLSRVYEALIVGLLLS